MKFDLSSSEIGTVQDIWHSLDFYAVNRQGAAPFTARPKVVGRTTSTSTLNSSGTAGSGATSSSSEIDISDLKFKFTNIEKFHNRLMIGYEDHDIHLTDEEIDVINYQFDQIIQLMTLIILNLHHLTNNVMEVLIKFSKINNRIYQLNVAKLGQLLMVTLLDVNPISNLNQTVFLDFLNQFFNTINHFTTDPYMDPIIDVNDYRLSLSDSNLSNLSLTNVNDLDVNSNLDNHSMITVDQPSLKLKSSFNPSTSASPAASYQKHLRQSSVTRSSYSINGDLNSINSKSMDEVPPQTIDIDQLEELTDDLDGIDSISTNDNYQSLASGANSDSDETNDDTFDLLNSFSAAAVNSNSASTKKSKRRLSSINLKSSKANLNLAKVNTNTSKSSKQDCIIM